MLRSMPFALVLATSTALLTGCTGGPTAPDGGSGVFTWGNVIDFLNSQGVDGVDICLHETDQCTESAADGSFQLNGLNEDEDILLSFDDNRYYPAVGHMNTARTVDNPWNYRLPTDDALALQANLADRDPVVRGQGQVFFAAAQATGLNQPRVAGLQVNPAAGSEGLGEAVYANDVNVPTPSLTETSSQGLAVFINVEPGIYYFEVTGGDCQPYFSHNSTDGGLTYPVHVFADTLSAVTVVCPD